VGLNGFHDNDLSLVVTRFGRHWTLEGRDRTGMEADRLTCLLCTDLEAISAAAFLGDTIRKKADGEPASKEELNSSVATISIKGVLVPPYSPKKELDTPAMREAPPIDRSTQFRWAAVSAAAGVSAGVIGGVFLWMNGNCATSDCSKLHSLKGPGIGLLVSSALLETAAVLLFSIKRKKETSR
jgi:hypothetical protein